ncbi:MAG: peroxide stress protein YaaA [Gammaproteobacteria bacterium]|nr:peroxide stress protein YaaA [Gammaproteobacteria bacterium]
MFILLSPAKRQSFETAPALTLQYTAPRFLKQTQALLDVLKEKTEEELQQLMSMSPALARLNAERFQTFNKTPGMPALFAFQGDVYQGLAAGTLTQNDIEFAQAHLMILSGLYGVLRPLDQIQPHRLEMGRKLATAEAKNLYQYWDGIITDAINQHLNQHQNATLINLASQEYFKSVQVKRLKHPVIHVDFKEHANGQYRVIALLAKRARGKMARYIISQHLNKPEAIKAFNVDGYQFSPQHSTEDRFVFVR